MVELLQLHFPKEASEVSLISGQTYHSFVLKVLIFFILVFIFAKGLVLMSSRLGMYWFGLYWTTSVMEFISWILLFVSTQVLRDI